MSDQSGIGLAQTFREVSVALQVFDEFYIYLMTPLESDKHLTIVIWPFLVSFRFLILEYEKVLLLNASCFSSALDLRVAYYVHR